MSPEQARGQSVDRRTDIWAYGCVLYEMLTGRRAFAGETLSDTLVHILEREPDWTVLPTDTPVAIRTLLRQCLRKDPHWRLHDIADARLDLETGQSSLASSESTVMDAARFRPRPMRERILWLIVALLTVALVTTSVTLMRDRTRTVAAPSPIEFAADPPEGWGLLASVRWVAELCRLSGRAVPRGGAAWRRHIHVVGPKKSRGPHGSGSRVPRAPGPHFGRQTVNTWASLLVVR